MTNKEKYILIIDISKYEDLDDIIFNVDKSFNKLVTSKRAFGEWGHPDISGEDIGRFFTINMDRVSHSIIHVGRESESELFITFNPLGKYTDSIEKLINEDKLTFAPRLIYKYGQFGEIEIDELITFDLILKQNG